MKHIHRYLIMTSLACALSQLAEAEIYRWVDDQGQVHYGEKAPDNTSSENMDNALEDTGNFVRYPELENSSAAHPENAKTTANETEQALLSKNDKTAITELEIDIKAVDFPIDEKNLDTWRPYLHAMYQGWRDWFGWPAKPPYPLNIRVFGSVKSFEARQKQQGRRVSSRSYYTGGNLREIDMKGTDPENTRTTLLHEASHAVLHMMHDNTSKWLNEGLAEVFSTIRVDRDEGPILVPEKEWAYVMKMMLDKGQLKPAADYLAIPSHRWKQVSKKEERQYYMFAWSLMYFLADSTEGQNTLKQVLQMNREKMLDGTALVKAFENTYPGGMEQFDEDWHESIKAL